MRQLIILVMLFCVCEMMAQHKIGIRAGLNQSTFSASSLEEGESYSFNGGFHFGVNYTYQLTPRFGVRGELLFTQRGSSFDYEDSDSYAFITPFGTGTAPFFEFGEVDTEIEHSNGYLSFPITAQFDLNDKIELFGGISLDLLIIPTGRGTQEFTSSSRPEDIFFRRTLEHSYRGDEIGDLSRFFNPLVATTFIPIIINDQQENIVRSETAYYNLRPGDLDGTKFNLFDSHIILGVNYFINNGFYIGIRGELGLFDITNEGADFSLKSIGENDSYIRRDDRDLSRSLSLSVGFRF